MSKHTLSPLKLTCWSQLIDRSTGFPELHVGVKARTVSSEADVLARLSTSNALVVAKLNVVLTMRELCMFIEISHTCNVLIALAEALEACQSLPGQAKQSCVDKSVRTQCMLQRSSMVARKVLTLQSLHAAASGDTDLFRFLWRMPPPNTVGGQVVGKLLQKQPGTTAERMPAVHQLSMLAPPRCTATRSAETSGQVMPYCMMLLHAQQGRLNWPWLSEY